MKWFGRTSGYYVFWTGFVYFWVGTLLAFTHSGLTQYATLGFIFALMIPLVCPPIARHFNMEPVMFDLFRKPKYPDIEEVETMKTPPPPVNPPKVNSDEANYTIGVNEVGSTQLRIRLDYGSATLTMTDQGVIDLIEDLAHSIRKEYVVEIYPKADAE